MKGIKQRSLSIILILAFFAANLTLAAYADTDWQVVGNSAFAEGTLIDSAFSVYNGTIYVAYRTNADQYGIVVKKFNGSSWEAVGSKQPCEASTHDLSIDVSNGTPYLAYRERLIASDYSYYSRITIKKFSNNIWETLGKQGIDDTYADGIAFKLDNGSPYLALKTVVGFGPAAYNKLTVSKYNGTVWNTVGNAEFLQGKLVDVLLCVSNGVPYVASRIYDTNKLKVMKLSGNSWINLGEDVNNEGHIVSMDVNNSIPYIAFSNSTTNMTVKKYEGGVWGNVGNISVSGRLGAPILQISNGRLYLSYVRNEKINIIKYSGTAWEIVGADIASSSKVQFAAENDSLYIAYNEGGITSGWKIARYNQPAVVNNTGTAALNQSNTIPQVSIGQINTKPASSITVAAAAGATDLLVSAESGPGYVRLSWNSLSHLKGLLGYYIYKSTAPGGQTNIPMTDLWIKDTNYTDTKVQTGMTYYYKVRPVFLGTPSKEASAAVGSSSSIKTVLQPQQGDLSWSGIWETDFGSMVLIQKGTEVSGVYGDKEYKITGVTTGNKLSGIIDEGGDYQGTIEFLMSSGGNSFSGKWKYKSDSEWSIWEGSRL